MKSLKLVWIILIGTIIFLVPTASAEICAYGCEHISPDNFTETNNITIEFFVNGSNQGGNLANFTLFIWNSTDNTLVHENTTNLTGGINQTSWNFTFFTSDATYLWNVLVANTSGQFNWTDDRNWTLILSGLDQATSVNTCDTPGVRGILLLTQLLLALGAIAFALWYATKKGNKLEFMKKISTGTVIKSFVLIMIFLALIFVLLTELGNVCGT